MNRNPLKAILNQGWTYPDGTRYSGQVLMSIEYRASNPRKTKDREYVKYGIVCSFLNLYDRVVFLKPFLKNVGFA